MIFNESNKILLDHHFFFKGEEIEITITHTYLGVLLTGISLVCDMHFSPKLARAMGPWPFLTGSVSRAISRTYTSRCHSWTLLFDP